VQEYFNPIWWDEWHKENYRRKLLAWHLKRSPIVAKIIPQVIRK